MLMKISQIVSYKITQAQVALTLLIVWLHVSAYYKVPECVGNVAIISVPCFWAISSFLYFISFDFSHPFTSYKTKVISRTKSLLIPFLLFSFLGMAFNLVSYHIHPLPRHPFAEVTSSNFVWFLYESKPNGPLWYLRSLYMFIWVAPILGYVIRLSKWSALLVIPFYFICQPVSYYYFPYWMVDIFTGAYLAIYYKELNSVELSQNTLTRTGGVIVALLILLLVWENGYLLRVISPLCALAIFSSVDLIPKKITMLLAPYSMLIYCLHLPISRITSKVPTILHLENPMLSLSLATILTIVIIICLGYILKKFPKVWSVLTGGR